LLGMNNPDGEKFAFVAAIVAFVVSLYRSRAFGSAGIEIVSDALGRIKEAKEAIESNIEGGHADLFSQAEQEIQRGEIDAGLWSHALINAKGNEQLRKVEYMKLRARQIKKQRNAAPPTPLE